MEFRKMVMITLYARQQKRHRCIEQSFGLYGIGRGAWCGRMALKHVYYHIRSESSVQVQCRIQEAWGWCTGMTQKDGMGREVGGGFRMGNTYTPVADACWCMAKPIQYCTVKKINKIIKKNFLKRKKKKDPCWMFRSLSYLGYCTQCCNEQRASK